MRQVILSVGTAQVQNPVLDGLNLYPPAPQRIIENYPNKKSRAHVPHCKGSHNQHYIKIRFLVSNILHHNGQFRTREKQDHAKDGIWEYLKDYGDRIAEKQCDENEEASEYDQGPSRSCPEANVPDHAASPVTHGDTAKKWRNKIHYALRKGNTSFGYLPIGKELVIFGNDCDHRISDGQRYLGESE
jgi:hypothetical protein